MSDSTALNTVNGVAASNVASTTSTTSNDSMGKEQFLQLLVTQMQYQDPLSPQDNTAYVAQLAQFSSLEQMENLNATATTLNGTTDAINSSLLVAQASNFIGKNVTWIDSNKTLQSGAVTSVKITDGTPSLIVNNKTTVPIGSVTLIGSASNSATGSTTN